MAAASGNSTRGINASLELANLEMEAKERAKKQVANLLQVCNIIVLVGNLFRLYIIFLTHLLLFSCLSTQE